MHISWKPTDIKGQCHYFQFLPITYMSTSSVPITQHQYLAIACSCVSASSVPITQPQYLAVMCTIHACMSGPNHTASISGCSMYTCVSVSSILLLLLRSICIWLRQMSVPAAMTNPTVFTRSERSPPSPHTHTAQLHLARFDVVELHGLGSAGESVLGFEFRCHMGIHLCGRCQV